MLLTLMDQILILKLVILQGVVLLTFFFTIASMPAWCKIVDKSLDDDNDAKYWLIWLSKVLAV